MIEDNEWLRSKALLALLHANGRDPAAAVTQLRTGLLSGFVRAKALHIVVTKPWPAPMGDGHVLINMDVPALLWAGLSGNSEIDLVEDVFWSNGQSQATGFHTVRLTGLLFAKSDAMTFLNLSDVLEGRSAASRTSSANEATARGRLPASAKPADRRYEPFAHEAAALVRGGAPLSVAIRQVARPMPPLAESSVEHGIRRAFGLMYGRDGRAIQP